jgi:hypothetical protein
VFQADRSRRWLVVTVRCRGTRRSFLFFDNLFSNCISSIVNNDQFSDDLGLAQKVFDCLRYKCTTVVGWHDAEMRGEGSVGADLYCSSLGPLKLGPTSGSYVSPRLRASAPSLLFLLLEMTSKFLLLESSEPPL